jgi:PTH1 family peptidyl-tRNA hydrolase
MALGEGRDPSDWLLFGLGNPGSRYAGTRHNLGWMLLDVLRERHHLTLVAGRGDYFAARGRLGEERIHLIKPTTFMNLSGRAVRQYLAIERPLAPAIVVAVDDAALSLGRIRLRPRGSAGGHNGLASVEEHLGSREFARLRMGCGPAPEAMDLADFVLEDFAPDERESVGPMLDRAADAFESWVLQGPEWTMSRFNG